MKIIAGMHKGKKITLPTVKITRSTTQVLREAIFNICRGKVSDARFLDLFAGSGAVGLEALSRGASLSYFIDKSYKAIDCIRKNIAFLKEEQRTKVLRSDAYCLFKVKRLIETPFDIIYIDPPYEEIEKDKIEKLFEDIVILNFLSEEGILFLETNKKDFFIKSQSLFLKSFRNLGETFLYEYSRIKS